MLEFAERAARTSESVLLLGETGCGKTHLAEIIHRLSTRALRPFTRVNCSAIPDTLVEREMFGHVQGAFTDAKEARAGLFEATNRGSLLLDEIAEIPLQSQTKLLTVLECRRVRRVGATYEIPVDVRIIAATNADLSRMVRQKQFRPDLFFRCAVLTYRVPPLRERRHQILELTRHLLQCRGQSPPTVSPDALRLLCCYSWPGNVRELDNALRRAVAFADDGVIRPCHLPMEVRHTRVLGDQRHATSAEVTSCRYVAPDDRQREMEGIREALRQENGNRTRAARRLGMSRTTLWAKLKDYPSCSDIH